MRDALSARLLSRAHADEESLGTVAGVGLGACGVLWDPDRPKDFLCFIVIVAPVCSNSGKVLAELLENELALRELTDAKIGFTLELGSGTFAATPAR
jgi:hypothetical protein